MMEAAIVKDFQWKSLAPLPSRRVYCSLVEVGGQVFAIGGCDDNGVPMDSFEVYSPEADQWNSLPPVPTARAGVAVATLGKRIMVIGGVGVNQMPLKIVEMYNVDEGKWKKRNSLREAAMGISVTAKGRSHAWKQRQSPGLQPDIPALKPGRLEQVLSARQIRWPLACSGWASKTESRAQRTLPLC
uniref:Kelch domain containing 8A n=1 Tax=Crocodylus porosus TaxID=8502 RepID=A0A7M4DUX6_CROPO